MKRLLKIPIIAALLLAPLSLVAQIPSGYVQTTATVPSLANGNFGAAWTNLSSSQQLGLLGCTSSFQTTVNGNFDASGHFAVLLADTAQICPSPSTWTFTFTFACPSAPPAGSFQVQVAVTGGGGTEDISSQITAALPANPCGGGSGGALQYPSPSVNAIPRVSSTGTATKLGNSALTDDGTTVGNSEGYTQSGTGANTFTGPLSGTSATFSGTVAATQHVIGPMQDKGGAYFNVTAYSNSPSAAYAAAGSGGSVYLPCGTYGVTSMLATAGSGGEFLGANAGCANWNFTGGSPTEAVLKLNGNSPSYVSGNRVANLRFGGNSNLTYGMEGSYLTATEFANLGSNGASSACFYFYAVVASAMKNLYCSSDYLPWSVQPQDGIVLDGGAGAQTTTSVLFAPTAAHAARYGIDLRSTANMALLAIQTGANGSAGVHVGSASFMNLVNGLMEGSGGTDAFLVDGTTTMCLQCLISGKNTHLSGTSHNTVFYQSYLGGGGGSPQVTIDSGSYGNVFRDTYAGWSAFSDSGHATRIDGVYDPASSGKMIEGFPQEQFPLPNGSGSYGLSLDYAVRLAGFWYASGATPQILSTDTYTTGKAWRAMFRGMWFQAGSVQDVPQLLMLDETNNTVTCGGATLTFTVNGSGKFQMYPTVSECGFVGEILFLPDNSHAATSVTNSIVVPHGEAWGGGTSIASSSNVCQSNGTNCQAIPKNYSVAWNPGAATASQCAEQTVSVTGLVTGKAVVASPPGNMGAHVWIGGVRASASSTVAVSFCADATGGTPSGGTWMFTQ